MNRRCVSLLGQHILLQVQDPPEFSFHLHYELQCSGRWLFYQHGLLSDNDVQSLLVYPTRFVDVCYCSITQTSLIGIARNGRLITLKPPLSYVYWLEAYSITNLNFYVFPL